jgi:hypothetical protein
MICEEFFAARSDDTVNMAIGKMLAECLEQWQREHGISDERRLNHDDIFDIHHW